MRILFVIVLLLGIGAAAQAQTVPNASPVVHSTAIEGNHVFCTHGCTLWSLTATTGASAGYLMVFDSPTDPADGTVSPTYCYPWAANTSGSIPWPVGAYFATGLTVVFSTGANCTTKTESQTAYFAAQVQ